MRIVITGEGLHDQKAKRPAYASFALDCAVPLRNTIITKFPFGSAAYASFDLTYTN